MNNDHDGCMSRNVLTWTLYLSCICWMYGELTSGRGVEAGTTGRSNIKIRGVRDWKKWVIKTVPIYIITFDV